MQEMIVMKIIIIRKVLLVLSLSTQTFRYSLKLRLDAKNVIAVLQSVLRYTTFSNILTHFVQGLSSAAFSGKF